MQSLIEKTLENLHEKALVPMRRSFVASIETLVGKAAPSNSGPNYLSTALSSKTHFARVIADALDRARPIRSAMSYPRPQESMT